MAEINRQDVKEIFTTIRADEANEYLQLGWILLDTFKTCYEPELFPFQQDLHYVLVWVKDTDPVKPESKYSDYNKLRSLE